MRLSRQLTTSEVMTAYAAFIWPVFRGKMKVGHYKVSHLLVGLAVAIAVVGMEIMLADVKRVFMSPETKRNQA